MSYSVFVGIDVSAQSVHVVYITSTGEMSEPFVIPQTRSGMDALRNVLLATGYEGAGMLVVMEATGVYWMKLAIYLHGAGFSVSVINPAQAHYFARALLQRNKTDRIDAQLLARLAAKLQPAPWQPLSETYEALYQRLTQRDTLFRMLQQERNRLHALKHRPQMVTEVAERLEAHIMFLQAQIAEIDEEFETVLVQDPAWARTADLLRSIKGFGPIATYWLLTATHNFTACTSPEQIASYSGLVPRQFESGSSVHGRPAIGHAPHARLRQALYMACLSAVQHNPSIKSFYQRLLDRGKPKKVALCACARKLIHIAWAVVMKEQAFDPDCPLPHAISSA